MARRPNNEEMNKADRLQEALRRIDKQLGYREVRGSNGLRFEVFGSPLGKTSPGSRYKKEEVTGEKLLKKMEELALYYKIKPNVAYARRPKKGEYRDPPPWLLDAEGKKFWNCTRRRKTVRGLPLASGIYCRRFGPKIRFVLSLKDPFRSTKGKIHLETKEHQTQKYIIWADVRPSGTPKVEAFRYLPADKRKYANNLMYEAALDFNRSMYTYVELRKMAPSEAYQKWIAENKKYHQAVLTLIAVSLAGPL